MKVTVYFDVLLLLNLVLNAALLTATACLLCRKICWQNIWLSAGIASAYLCLCLLTGMGSDFPVKLAVSAIMVFTAYRPQTAAAFMQLLAVFYLMSFMLAGSVYGCRCLFGSNFGLTAVPGAKLLDIIVGLAALPLLCLLLRHSRQNFKLAGYSCEVEIVLNEVTVKVQGYLDTGNFLRSNAGVPVILMNYRAALPLFSAAVRQYLTITSADDWLLGLKDCQDRKWTEALKFVSAQGVGKSSVLLGFCPQAAVVVCEGKRTAVKCVICLCSHGFAVNGKADILLNAAFTNLFERG